MKLPPVKYTKQRGGRYHLNIPIPPAIRPEYKNKVAYEKTTGTSDPVEAERQVTAQRAHMDIQVSEAQRRAKQAKLRRLLDPTDAAAVDAIGGPSKLPTTIEGLRSQAAFLLAGYGASDVVPDRDVDTARWTVRDPNTGKFFDSDAVPIVINTGGEDIAPDVMADMRSRAEDAAHRAFMDTVTAEIRRYKSTAASLGEQVSPAPKFLDEGVSGIRDLATKLAKAKGYSKQNRDAMMYTVRRWIELHGDAPLHKLTRAHIGEFSDALKDLPTTRKKRVQSQDIRKAIATGKSEGLETMGDKMRQTRIDHIKMLTLYAVNHGLMDADPFTGFKFVKAKGRHSDKAKNKTKPFSPADIRTILPHCASNFHEDTLDYWAPIISAYTGARREEIGQLYVSDVTNWGNSLKIKLTDEGEDQKVKNQHSFRTIPVPPILLEAGFGEFVTRRRQAGGKMLFLEDYTNPDHSKVLREVQTTGRERFSETYGTRFGRKVKVPLKISGEGLTFHSFRHSWTDAARRAGISAEIRRLIAGRLDDEDAVESQYGGADLLREKLNAMIEVAPYLTLDAELPDDSQPDL